MYNSSVNVNTKLKVTNKQNLRKKNTKLEKIFIFSMLVIPIVQFIIFWFFVNIKSILLAFKIPTGEWSMETFQYVFESFVNGLPDPLAPSLWESLLNSLLFWSTGVLMIPFNLFIAYFIYKRIGGYKLWQVMIYLPGIIGSMVMITAFKSMLRPDYGTIGIIFRELFNFHGGLLYNSKTAIWVIVFYSLWMGWGNSLMLLAGSMARIPVELLESARIDGVGPFRELTQIILPLVWPTLSTIIILSLTTLFTTSGGVLVFTGGAYGTYTISYWMFDMQRTGSWGYNKVSAAGIILTIITVPIVLIVRKIVEKIEVVDY